MGKLGQGARVRWRTGREEQVGEQHGVDAVVVLARWWQPAAELEHVDCRVLAIPLVAKPSIAAERGIPHEDELSGPHELRGERHQAARLVDDALVGIVSRHQHVADATTRGSDRLIAAGRAARVPIGSCDEELAREDFDARPLGCLGRGVDDQHAQRTSERKQREHASLGILHEPFVR